jgi:glycosyltransferase involved in cell wall biosynthesis
MKLCYLGPYDGNHPRNRSILRGLKENGVEIVECNSVSSVRPLDYLRLLQRQRALDYDILLLGSRGEYYGQPLVPIIKKLTKRPVVFDAVLTLIETIVEDRQLIKEKSFRRKFSHILDYWAFRSSDLILSDTLTHSKYYSSYYNIEQSKFRRLFISADDSVFFPMESSYLNENTFLVMFWGGFVPLQGVKYIIQAAKLLKSHNDIKFEIRGYGQTYAESIQLCKKLNCKNVHFISRYVPYQELPTHIAKASVCLGVFGGTHKATRVIPTKAVETLAMRKPLITGDSPAARELFQDKFNALLPHMANPRELADAILMLKQDEHLRFKIAQNGYRLFKDNLCPRVIGEELKRILCGLTERDPK